MQISGKFILRLAGRNGPLPLKSDPFLIFYIAISEQKNARQAKALRVESLNLTVLFLFRNPDIWFYWFKAGVPFYVDTLTANQRKLQSIHQFSSIETWINSVLQKLQSIHQFSSTETWINSSIQFYRNLNQFINSVLQKLQSIHQFSSTASCKENGPVIINMSIDRTHNLRVKNSMPWNSHVIVL